MKRAGLPPQPVCNKLALPDIKVLDIKLSGASGPIQPNKTYNINVKIRNDGQCETGVFFVQLKIRTQVPGMRKDDTVVLGTQKVFSIPPL